MTLFVASARACRLWLSIIVAAAISSAHEVCLDGTAKANIAMTYCTDYDRNTCCSSSKESQIRTLVDALNTTLCRDWMKKLLCAECDPWAAHLFDYEASPSGRRVPLLCDDYCQDFYSLCSAEVMHWPSSDNYFSLGAPASGSPLIIRSYYSTETSFCAAHTPVNDFNACYSGAPFVPSSPPPPPLDSPTLCVEQHPISVTDTTTNRVTAVVSKFDGTDRMFVARQGGTITVVRKTNGASLGTFLALPNVETRFNEGGFLGLVFHPTDAARFFVAYSCPNSVCRAPCTASGATGGCNGRSCGGDGFCTGLTYVNVVSEFRVNPSNPNQALLSSERRLLSLAKPYDNHNGGQLLFGPTDGFLYITTGDGGSANDPFALSQNRRSLMGKVLRIDVDGTPDAGKQYRVPTDNPFYSAPDALPEVWALGLRNPWRCSFDRARPTYLFCGDVGQDAIEEFDLIVKGGNYGWRKWEGTRLNVAADAAIPNQILPFIEFTHGQLGGNPSSIGGYVYRGSRDPRLVGRYVLGDHNPTYWLGIESEDGNWDVQRLTLRCANYSAGCATSGKLNAFGEDEEGELYIATSSRVLKLADPRFCGISLPTTTTSATATTPATTSGGGGTVIDFPLVEDAYVRSGSFAAQNFGSETVLTVKNAPSSDFERATLLKFDSSATAGASPTQCWLEIRSAVLNPYDGDFRVSIRLLSPSSWQEGTVTWTNQPSAVGGAPQVSSVAAIPGTNTYDVTALVLHSALGSRISLGLYAADLGDTFDRLDFPSREAGTGFPRLRCTVATTTGVATTAQPTTAQPTTGALTTGALTTGVLTTGGTTGSGPQGPSIWVGQAVEDAYVRDGAFATAPLGLEAILTVKRASGSGFSREALLRFDLSGLSSSAPPIVCLLALKGVVIAPHNPPFYVRVDRLTAFASTSWNETTVTWNTRPTGVAQTTAPLAIGTGDAYLDVTDLVAQRVEPQDLTLRVRGENSVEDRLDAVSREGGRPAQLLCVQ